MIVELFLESKNCLDAIYVQVNAIYVHIAKERELKKVLEN